MKVVCREVCKSTGQIAVYPIESEVTERLLFCLRLRARVNPELRYFVTTRVRWEDKTLRESIERLLRRRDVTPRALEAFGGIVEL